MRKILDCRDITGDCDFRSVGETFETVLVQAAAHAKNEHGLTMTAEFIEKARAAMRDEQAGNA